jgi:DNA-binding transcriptional LysR family regulator
MSASADDLIALLVFARVVQAQSFTKAAAALGISKSLVSARIAELEERLSMRLLLRTTRRLSLTADGLALYERAAELARAADLATELAVDATGEPHGVLRVNAPVVFGEMHLATPIAKYLEQYPRVRVQLQLSDRFEDLVEAGVDVAIRITSKRNDSALVGKKLADDVSIVCAAPEYLVRRGRPATPQDLLQHECLRYSLMRVTDEWRFHDGRDSVSIPVDSHFESTNGGVLKSAALAGVGLVVLPSFMVMSELASGKLVRVLEEYKGPAFSIAAVYTPAKRVPRNVRSFIDLLVRHFEKPAWKPTSTR